MEPVKIWIVARYNPFEGCFPIMAYVNRDDALRDAARIIAAYADALISDDWIPLDDQSYPGDLVQIEAHTGSDRFILFGLPIVEKQP